MKIATCFNKLATKRSGFKLADIKLYLHILFNVLLYSLSGKTAIHSSALSSTLMTNEKVNKKLLQNGFTIETDLIAREMYITDISWSK